MTLAFSPAPVEEADQVNSNAQSSPGSFFYLGAPLLD